MESNAHQGRIPSSWGVTSVVSAAVPVLRFGGFRLRAGVVTKSFSEDAKIGAASWAISCLFRYQMEY